MDLIEDSYDGQHLLRFPPMARMCVKGFLIGSVISSVQPEEENLFDGEEDDLSDGVCASPGKISALAMSTLYLLMHNISWKQPNLILSVILDVGFSSLLKNPGERIPKPVMKTIKKVATIFFKFALIVNLGIMLVKERGWIPIVALAMYLITTTVDNANFVPQKVYERYYKIIKDPVFDNTCNALIYTGKSQLSFAAMGVGHLAYRVWLNNYGTEKSKKEYYGAID